MRPRVQPQRLDLPLARVEDGVLVATVVYIDRFGNLQLNVEHHELTETTLKLGRAVSLEMRGTHDAHYALTFADVAAGELLIYEDAHRQLAVAVSRGNAADRLGARIDDEARISAK